LIAVDAGKAVQLFREDRNNDMTPVVVLGFESFENSDSVAWDVVGASRRAVQALIDKGCRRIVHVTMDWILTEYPREQRRRGYTEAMAEAGLEPRFLSVEDESSAGASRAAGQMLVEGERADAFFCLTDTLAIGVTNALIDAGVRVPEDCMVWGFGDFPEAAEFRVPLSTIRVPVGEVVEQAWTWLRERMENPDTEYRLVVLDMELVERASTLRR
jgi:DNA-binding LacI/PurR family transcriptional regulator